jgi:hypothetical protein
MRFIRAAIFGAIAYALFPADVFHIPFSQLASKDIYSLIGAVFLGIMAIATLLKAD